jgi:hypothetical protein
MFGKRPNLACGLLVDVSLQVGNEFLAIFGRDQLKTVIEYDLHAIEREGGRTPKAARQLESADVAIGHDPFKDTALDVEFGFAKSVAAWK